MQYVRRYIFAHTLSKLLGSPFLDMWLVIQLDLYDKSETAPVARSFQFKLTEQKIIRKEGTQRFPCKDLQLFTYLKLDVKKLCSVPWIQLLGAESRFEEPRGKRTENFLAQVLNVEMFCSCKENVSAVRVSILIKCSLLKFLGLEINTVWSCELYHHSAMK